MRIEHLLQEHFNIQIIDILTFGIYICVTYQPVVLPIDFLTAILHRGLRNDFFFSLQFTFSNFYLDFYFPFLFGHLFPFSIWTFIFLFLFGLLAPFFIWDFLFQFEFQFDYFEFQFDYFEFQFEFQFFLISFSHQSRSHFGFLPNFLYYVLLINRCL